MHKKRAAENLAFTQSPVSTDKPGALTGKK